MSTETEQSKCGNCGLVLDSGDTEQVDDFWERVLPGETMPTGQCPDCDCLCHPVEDPNDNKELLFAFVLVAIADGNGFHDSIMRTSDREFLDSMVEDARQVVATYKEELKRDAERKAEHE